MGIEVPGLGNCGIDARDRLIRYTGLRETSCVTNGKDAFGRWLATCSTNGGDLSAWLVREGLGMAFIRYSNAYVAEEAIARSAQKQMWAGTFIAPWDWSIRTGSTAILGSYKPTEQQERLRPRPPWPRRTNFWRKATSPARGPKQLRSGKRGRVPAPEKRTGSRAAGLTVVKLSAWSLT
jgi:hypothetical protein